MSSKAAYQARKARGLCQDCPARRELGSPYCEPCRLRRNAQQEARRKDRAAMHRAAGLCVRCPARRSPKSTAYCPKHLKQLRLYGREAWYRKHPDTRPRGWYKHPKEHVL